MLCADDSIPRTNPCLMKSLCIYIIGMDSLEQFIIFPHTKVWASKENGSYIISE